MPISGKKLVSAVAIYSIGDFLLLGISGFVLLPLYLHHMTPAEYGLFASVNAVSALLCVLIMLGSQSSISRFYFIARGAKVEGIFLASMWIFQTIVALAMGVLLIFFGRPLWNWLLPSIPFYPYAWLTLFSGLLAFSSGIYSLWLRLQERATVFVIIQLIGASASLIFMWLFLVIWKGGALGGLWALLSVNILMSIIAFIALGCRIPWRFEFRHIKESFTFGFLMMLGTFGFYLVSKSQIFILQHFCTLSTIGIFNLALQISGVLTILCISFSKAWEPIVFAAESREAASEIIAKTAKGYIAVAVYATVGMILLSGVMLRIIARPAYYGAAPLLRIVLISSFFYTCTQLTSSALDYEKRAGIKQIATAIFALLTIGFSFILVPHWQALGAAWAQLVSCMLYTIFSFWTAQRALKVNYDWRALFIIILMGALIIAMDFLSELRFQSGFVIIKLGLLIIYPFLLWLCSAFDAQEIQALQDLVRSSSLGRIVRTP